MRNVLDFIVGLIAMVIALHIMIFAALFVGALTVMYLEWLDDQLGFMSFFMGLVG